nr:unnamed protein product [Digitaria exilis]
MLFQGLRAKIADYDVFQQYQQQQYEEDNYRIPYKTDVYSFGVVLLELLTGRRPRDMRQGYLSYWLLDWVRKSLVLRCHPVGR